MNRSHRSIRSTDSHSHSQQQQSFDPFSYDDHDDDHDHEDITQMSTTQSHSHEFSQTFSQSTAMIMEDGTGDDDGWGISPTRTTSTAFQSLRSGRSSGSSSYSGVHRVGSHRTLSRVNRSSGLSTVASGDTNSYYSHYDDNSVLRASTSSASASVFPREARPDVLARQPNRGSTFNPNGALTLGVEVRAVDFHAKVAFEPRPAVPEEYRYESSDAAIGDKKVKSPSLLHCEVLERMRGQQYVRQLAWKAGVSDQVRVFSSVDAHYHASRLVNAKEYLASLPVVPPTILKHRLPLRCDVGFPNASPEEIQLKEREICIMAEQEELQPRILLLAGAFVDGMVESNGEVTNMKSEYDEYSIFAPPIESIASTSKLWRSRPFQDRPPGMKYFVASPLDLILPGKLTSDEPLIGYLSLYYLKKGQSKQSRCGYKISEDFIFSAGNWKGLNLKEEASQFIQRTLLGTASFQSGKKNSRTSEGSSDKKRKRKKKALFSYDPIALQNVEETLFVVIQINRITQSDIFRKQKKSFFSPGNNYRANGSVAKSIYSNFGSQFLSPHCFGIFPAPVSSTSFGDMRLSWPQGSVQSCSLFPYPKNSLSEKSFVESLYSIVHENGRNLKGLNGGSAELFISLLGSDFCQVLQQTPVRLKESDVNDDGVPRLLVDFSGDGAIMMNPENNSKSISTNERSRRSDLVRLPQSPRPCGYIDSYEIKEVFFLPPRFSDEQDSEHPLLNRTFINMLYIYPIRISTKHVERSERDKVLSLRLRVVRQTIIVDDLGSSETLRSTVDCLYNPAPGRPTLQAVYTKVLPCRGEKVVHYRDEFKVRLPSVLDGSYFLQFSLFNLQVNETDLEGSFVAEVLAESMVPLSEISEPSYKYQVSTILANGLHNVDLGNYELLFETRVFSSIHLSDPSLATMFSHSSEMGNTHDKKSGRDPFRLTFTDILGNASPYAVANHFHSLAFVHLFQLVKRGKSNPENMSALFEILGKVRSIKNNPQSLRLFFKDFFDIFDETAFVVQPKNLTSINSKGSIMDQASFFVDEDHGLGRDISSPESKEDTIIDAAIDTVEEMLLEAAVYVIAFQHARTGTTDSIKFGRTSSNVSRKEPFSRKAFGASNVDRMRVEAEMDDEAKFSQYYEDDDESVFSRSQATSIHQNYTRDYSNSFRDSTTYAPVRSTFDSIQSHTPRERSTLNDLKDRIRKHSVTKAMTNMAQVAVVPCVAPVFGVTSIFRKNKLTVDDKDMTVVEDRRRMLYTSGTDVEEEIDPLLDPNRVFICDGKLGYYDCGPSFLVYPDVPKIRGVANLYDRTTPFSLPLQGKKKHGNSFVYESIIILWIKAWMSTYNSSGEGFESPSVAVELFFANIDFILPLCLKSLALRLAIPDVSYVGEETINMTIPSVLDSFHIETFLLFMDVLAYGSMRFAIKNHIVVLSSSKTQRIPICDETAEFLIGLLALLHPSQVALLIDRFITTLFIAEHDDGEILRKDFSSGQMRVEHYFGKVQPSPVEESSAPSEIVRANCSRKIRLRIISKLSQIPSFCSINYPLKYPMMGRRSASIHASWTHQLLDRVDDGLSCPYNDDVDRLPRSHWLAELLVHEALSICSYSVQVGFNSNGEATISYIKNLATCRNLANEAIFTLYDCLLCRHSLDKRFQSDSAKKRICSMFAIPIVVITIREISNLSRMPPTNKIRCLWLSCFLYVCQEAPEQILRDHLRQLVLRGSLQQFLRLLKLCTMSFQNFIGIASSNVHGFLHDLSYLIQESFNTICATIILLIDECADVTLSNPGERSTIAQIIFDLLLFIVTVPQSSITLTRALGAVCLAVDKFAVILFVETCGENLQHWNRVLVTLLNSAELSVRSVAVDLFVTLVGGIFDEYGCIDSFTLQFMTILPEVVAREIGLFALQGKVNSVPDLERCVWPLRRALGDLEEADPEDDDRVDRQLSHILSTFCQDCQAIIDCVFIELRIDGDPLVIAGKPLKFEGNGNVVFDADEESLFQAANAFKSEVAPMQRLRWLLILKKLHESKEQWIEAAEANLLCARAICDAIPHIPNVWQPSLFKLWRDPNRSSWLMYLAKSNLQVSLRKKAVEEIILFSERFLESPIMIKMGALKERPKVESPLHTRLYEINVPSLCKMLTMVTKAAIINFADEGHGSDTLAFVRIESLLKNVIGLTESFCDPTRNVLRTEDPNLNKKERRKVFAQNNAALRQMSTNVNSLLAKLASSMAASQHDLNGKSNDNIFVRVLLLGRKPQRFSESTSIPTFIEWDTPYICRVKGNLVEKANILSKKSGKGPEKVLNESTSSLNETISRKFAEPLIEGLSSAFGSTKSSIIFCLKRPSDSRLRKEGVDRTFLVVSMVEMGGNIATNNALLTSPVESKRFFSKNFVPSNNGKDVSQDLRNLRQRKEDVVRLNNSSIIIESTVGQKFPCALSRQRVLITAELVPGMTNS